MFADDLDLEDANHLSIFEPGNRSGHTFSPSTTHENGQVVQRWRLVTTRGCDPFTCLGYCDKAMSGFCIDGFIGRFGSFREILANATLVNVVPNAEGYLRARKQQSQLDSNVEGGLAIFAVNFAPCFTRVRNHLESAAHSTVLSRGRLRPPSSTAAPSRAVRMQTKPSAHGFTRSFKRLAWPCSLEPPHLGPLLQTPSFQSGVLLHSVSPTPSENFRTHNIVTIAIIL